MGLPYIISPQRFDYLDKDFLKANQYTMPTAGPIFPKSIELLIRGLDCG